MDKIKLIAIIVILLIFSSIIPQYVFADRVSVQLQEVDLYPAGSARGVYVAPEGSVFVLDLADEIWKVDPETGDYSGFYGIGGYELYDISPQDDEWVWWTDASQLFGSFNSTNGQVKYWELVDEGDDYWGNMPQLGPLAYDGGVVWLSEWMGQYFGFLRFDPLTGEICSYDVSIHAADLLVTGDDIWVLDWYLDALLLLDSTSGEFVKYSTGRYVGMDANLQTDGDLLWLSEDVLGGDILSFDPATLSMTVYDVPESEWPVNLTLREGRVWYTNANGSFGRLDPNLVSGTHSTLDQVIIQASIDPVCKNLGSGITSDATPDYDTSPWTMIESTSIEVETGLLSYSLPEGAEPFGIVGTMADLWLSDSGRQKLIRMPITVDAYVVYLPLVIK